MACFVRLQVPEPDVQRNHDAEACVENCSLGHLCAVDRPWWCGTRCPPDNAYICLCTSCCTNHTMRLRLHMPGMLLNCLAVCVHTRHAARAQDAHQSPPNPSAGCVRHRQLQYGLCEGTVWFLFCASSLQACCAWGQGSEHCCNAATVQSEVPEKRFVQV